MTEPTNPLVDALRTETDKARKAMTTELATIDVPNTSAKITATMIDGKPFVALRPMCEALGIDADTQRRKLAGKSWACTVIMTVEVGGQGREMFMIDRRTMTMWLATIDENRVAEEARPTVQAFQAEAADALDAYFSTGVATRPTAPAPASVPEPINDPERVVALSEAQMRVINLARGLVSDDYLASKAKIVMGRALGEVATIDPQDMPLTVTDYLKHRGIPNNQIKSLAPHFGKLLAGTYRDTYGTEPETAPQEVGGRIIDVKVYTEKHRHLFDTVWTGTSGRHRRGCLSLYGSSHHWTRLGHD